MNKKPLIVTGLNGLVGSKFSDLYQDKYELTSLDVSHPTAPTDITDYLQVLSSFKNSSAQHVLHLAAFTDVNAAWEQRGDRTGLAYRVNGLGTENIIKAAAATGKHVIHISTAFVFDGEKGSMYTEEDEVHPIEWYGQTKAEAETVVKNSNTPWTILRIDFPFRFDTFSKPDIIRKTLTALERGYPLFSNHYFGPTVIEDFCDIVDWVVRTNTTGIFNASSGEKWSDFQLGQELIKQLDLHYQLKEGNLDEYLKTLNRPYQKNTAMDTTKLKNVIDFELHTVRDAIKKIQLHHE